MSRQRAWLICLNGEGMQEIEADDLRPLGRKLKWYLRPSRSSDLATSGAHIRRQKNSLVRWTPRLDEVRPSASMSVGKLVPNVEQPEGKARERTGSEDGLKLGALASPPASPPGSSLGERQREKSRKESLGLNSGDFQGDGERNRKTREEGRKTNKTKPQPQLWS